jgi:Glycosyl transferase family 2
MSEPEVSVVIPTRNRWALLQETALPAALSQQDVRLEVLVVDDGSVEEPPPGSWPLADPRVRRLRHERSRGVAAARNTGIAAARGRVVALLDDDDLWAPRKLRTQLDAIDAAGADFCYCSALVLDAQRRVFELSEAPAPEVLRAQLLTRYAIPAGASNVVASLALLRRVGGFDERISYLADWDMWLRLASAGSAAACPEHLVGYVRHEGRMLPSRRTVLAELDVVLGKHAGTGLTIDPARFLFWVAFQHRQAGRQLAAARILAETAFSSRRPGYLVRATAALLDGPHAAAARRFLRRRSPPRPIALPADGDWLVRLSEAA